MIYIVLLALVVGGAMYWFRDRDLPRLAKIVPAIVIAIAGFLGFRLLIGTRSRWAPTITLLSVAAFAALVWFLLFSGRVRTATPQFRARLMHVVFTVFFVGYALAIVLWLVAGLSAGIAGHSRSLHERLHTYGGAPEVLTVRASAIAPFSIDGSSRIREMTFRTGSRATIEFTNSPADPATSCVGPCSRDENLQGVPIEHNISIYRLAGEPVFLGEHITPARFTEGPDKGLLFPAITRYEFDAPGPGVYAYRCDVHPLVMRGSVRVLPATAVVTNPTIDEGPRDIGRRIAEVSHAAEPAKDIAFDYAFSLVSLGLGIFLVLLRPRERMARVFGVAMIGTAAAYNLQSHAALATVDTFDLLHTFLHPITGVTYIYALVLFPDGRLIPRFSNQFGRLFYRIAFFIACMIFLGVTGGILPDFNQHPAALVLWYGMAIPLIGMAAQWYRIRHAPTSESRQQSRLLLFALAASFGIGLVLLLALGIDLSTLLNPTGADPTAIVAADARAFRVFQPLFVVIPLALFFGILRYRLWDIDLVIRRTIVYGALAGFIGAVYVGVVVVLGGAIGGRIGLSIATTVLVAVAFDPLRTRLQRLANRLVYGERASPYTVMAGLAHRLAGVTAPAEVVQAIAEEVARGVGAARARATLFMPSGAHVVGTSPPGEDEPLYDRTITLSHQGEPVGELAVGKKPGDPLRSSENRLLESVGSQVAIALHSLRLAERLRTRLIDLQRSTAQLEASRRRIVSAQDAERSRLERDIHERVEEPLVAIASTVEAAEGLGTNGGGMLGMLEEAAAEANRVQDVLRDLARGIFPPLLADRGLVPALESQARKTAASVVVRAAGLEERFDPHTEAAVYFCCVEAMRSAARRTAGSTIDVELTRDDEWISFEVRDAAHGLTDAAVTGADLQLMVDRIEAVGGNLEVRAGAEGTTVFGRVPAQPFAAAHSSASRSGSNADFGT